MARKASRATAGIPRGRTATEEREDGRGACMVILRGVAGARGRHFSDSASIAHRHRPDQTGPWPAVVRSSFSLPPPPCERRSPAQTQAMSMPQVDDQTLVERVRAGDARAFEELVSRYENKVYRLAIKLTRNEALAEEVLQEVFIKIYEKLDSFRGESALSSWIYRIAANASFSKLNLEKRHQHADLEDTMPAAE